MSARGPVLAAAAALALAAARPAPAQEARAAADTVPRPAIAPISPWGAFARSLAVPGWGQSELDAKTRGAAYFVAETASLWMWVRTQRRLDQARRNHPDDHPLVRARRQQREDWITLTVFWAFFNAADAWVTAHLYGFEAKPLPVPGESVVLFVGWSWPTGGP